MSPFPGEDGRGKIYYGGPHTNEEAKKQRNYSVWLSVLSSSYEITRYIQHDKNGSFKSGIKLEIKKVFLKHML